jgi:hypothetical protein
MTQPEQQPQPEQPEQPKPEHEPGTDPQPGHGQDPSPSRAAETTRGPLSRASRRGMVGSGTLRARRLREIQGERRVHLRVGELRVLRGAELATDLSGLSLDLLEDRLGAVGVFLCGHGVAPGLTWVAPSSMRRATSASAS